MSLIAPEDNIVLFAVIVAAAALGIWSEHKQWLKQVSGILITPAILVGILGYVIGTFIGVSIAMALS